MSDEPRDEPVETDLAGLVNNAHPSAAQFLQQFVIPEVP